MSYINLTYHIIFRTKSSRPVIVEEHERELYTYIYGVIKRSNCVLYRIGGMPDHIHMLVDIHPSISVADFVHKIKLAASAYIKRNKEMFPHFEGWGRAYCALTYARDDKETVRQYIMNQKEHHKKVSFADELRQLLADQGVEYDPRYFLTEE